MWMLLSGGECTLFDYWKGVEKNIFEDISKYECSVKVGFNKTVSKNNLMSLVVLTLWQQILSARKKLCHSGKAWICLRKTFSLC